MNRLGLISVTVCICLITNCVVFGQKQITAKIIDVENRKPIKDAIISVEGSTTETVSNILGFFQLTVDSNDTLIIDAKGYEKSKIAIPDTHSFQIGLKKLAARDSTTVKVVEESATFPGGLPKFYEYLLKNIKMPRDARGISGKVFVEFVIDSTGQILPEDIKVIKSLSQSCDAEAIRLIKGSPKWIPGRLGNKRTRQRMVMPIGFNL